MKPELTESRFEFVQDADCCADSSDAQVLEVEVHDGGGGKFFRLKTEGFAVDSGADLESLFVEIRKLYGEAWDK